MFDLITNIDIATEEACDNIMESMLLSYDKMVNIMRYDDNINLDNFAIFQEGKIMDDVKERGKGQSKLKKIITFIPRLIMSIINFLKNKFLKKKDKNKLSEINKAIKDPKKFGVLKALLAGAGAGVAAGAVGKSVIDKSYITELKKDIKDLNDKISKFGQTIDDLKFENDRKDKKINYLEEDLKDSKKYGDEQFNENVHMMYKEQLKEQIIAIKDAILLINKKEEISEYNKRFLENNKELLKELEPLKSKINSYHYTKNDRMKLALDLVGKKYAREYKEAFDEFEKLYDSVKAHVERNSEKLKEATETVAKHVKIDDSKVKIETNIKAAIKAINLYNNAMEKFFKDGTISKAVLHGYSHNDDAFEFVDSEELEKYLYDNSDELYKSLDKAHELGQKFYDEYVEFKEQYGSIKKSKLSGNEDEDDKLQIFLDDMVDSYISLSRDLTDSLTDLERTAYMLYYIDDSISISNRVNKVESKAADTNKIVNYNYKRFDREHDAKITELRERDKEKKED